MKSKIGLALALALFALGINQANAAAIYLSCSGGNKSETNYFDLQVDMASGEIIGPSSILGKFSVGPSKITETCSVETMSVKCSIKGGFYKFSEISLSRLSGHLNILMGIPNKDDDAAAIYNYDCKLIPKKLF